MRGSGKDGSSCGGGGMCWGYVLNVRRGRWGIKIEQVRTRGDGRGGILGILWKHNNLMSQWVAAINVME